MISGAGATRIVLRFRSQQTQRVLEDCHPQKSWHAGYALFGNHER